MIKEGKREKKQKKKRKIVSGRGGGLPAGHLGLLFSGQVLLHIPRQLEVLENLNPKTSLN